MKGLSQSKALKFAKTAAALAFALSAAAWALTSPFKNLGAIMQGVGFQNYQTVSASRVVKLAVLDNGFKGYADELGKNLPSNTVYHAGPVKVDPGAEEVHGLYMAELAAALLNSAPGVSYELHLYSAFGYSNLEAAVKDVISKDFDIVLYAQVWEYGGNGDGRGFINALVNQALDKGIIWINAAGNFGVSTYRAPIGSNDDGWVKLPAPNDVLRIRCQKGRTGHCPLRVVLSWNDFNDDVNAGTDKDLDLILTDDTLKIVGSSALQQMKKIPEGTPGASLYPREFLNQMVSPGVYFVRVKDRSRNFDKSRDRLRVTVSGENVNLLDASGGETMLAPADNPGVVTVGASDTEMSSNSARLQKPELKTPSLITLQNGDQYLGSSNAAAITAAAATVLKALNPGITRAELLAALSAEGTLSPEGKGLPVEVLQFRPTGNRCFLTVGVPAQVSFAARDFLRRAPRGSAFVVDSTKGVKILTVNDPFMLVNAVRAAGDDMLVATPDRFVAIPRINQERLPYGYVEIAQIPRGQVVCGLDSNSPFSRRLRLPANPDVTARK